ncbi:hypothetical protein KUCAC02_028230 [Chaenocephalus aceratus]|uniref:Uncharacterized protein n=1 Tax=Chaenocephalus aceratus TaxID=36190 RepID=A0ACB9X195_CHAAC|nr:hypothetical protein KUCAC02_028230 [Chaenocephalus aceratus]
MNEALVRGSDSSVVRLSHDSSFSSGGPSVSRSALIRRTGTRAFSLGTERSTIHTPRSPALVHWILLLSDRAGLP